jgi:hypothetical protein
MKKRTKKELENIEYNKNVLLSVDAHNRGVEQAREDEMNRELYDKSYAFFEEQLKQYSPEVVKE